MCGRLDQNEWTMRSLLREINCVQLNSKITSNLRNFHYKTVCHHKIVWSLRPTGAKVFYAVNNNNNRLQPHEIYIILGGG